MALLTPSLTLTPDLNTQVADLQNRVAALESVLQIQSPGVVLLKALNSISVETGTFSVRTDTTATIVVGSNFSLRCSGSADLRASTTMNVQTSASMTIRGSMVNIN